MITVATYKVELAEQLATIKAFIRRGVPIRITPYTQDKAAPGAPGSSRPPHTAYPGIPAPRGTQVG